MFILSSLLFLGVCSGKVLVQNLSGDESLDLNLAGNELLRIKRPAPDDQRMVRSSDSYKTFGKEGHYLSTVIYIDVPPFSDSTEVDNVDDSTDKFDIHFSNIKFCKLSSAYALSYRIDLDANMVQLLLSLGKGQIKGLYSISSPPSTNSTSEEFVLNLYSHLIYSHDTLFEVEDGNVILGKSDNKRLIFRKVKGKYTNPPSELRDNFKNYLNPKLMEVVANKIYEEVQQRVSNNYVTSRIKTEIAFRNRNETAERLKKAIADAFDDIHQNAFNVFFYDSTNFNRIINNFEVKIPAFILRDVREFSLQDVKISFVSNEVRGKAKFLLSSPVVEPEITYRNLSDPFAVNKTIVGEYQLFQVTYEFEMIAKLHTASVEFGTVDVSIADVEVSPTQGLYGDERDIIIRKLPPYLKSYFMNNCYYSFSRYCKGILDEGRIAYQVFK